MKAANVVSALSHKQAEAMHVIMETVKTDRNLALILLEDLLSRTFNASARHSIRCQAQSIGL
ncbi:MAG: hypothetical protein ACYCXC_00255 [Acidovorax defluvii]